MTHLITQPRDLIKNKIANVFIAGNSAAVVSGLGISISVSGGTQRDVAVTSFAASLRRVGLVSGSGAGNSAGLSVNSRQYFRGDAAGLGGFYFASRFLMSDLSTNVRAFVGLVPTNSLLASADPSALTDVVGMGFDSTDTTFRILHNDASGAATEVDLGAGFPSNSLTAVYELILDAPPNGSTIAYTVNRLDAGTSASGTLSTNLPTNTTLLAPQVWVNNGGDSETVGIDLVSLYIETD